jgi:nicotinamidase-related amidase
VSKPVLCIVDVQPEFGASKQIVEQTIALVAKFRRSGFPIFLVEYSGYGGGYNALYKAMLDYGPLYRVFKKRDDGSNEVIAAAEANNVSLDRIVICGVNTCCCVHDTATGIIQKIPCVIKPVKAALACGCSWNKGADCVAVLIDHIARAERDRKERELEQQRAGQW